jgi:hypothetical protein
VKNKRTKILLFGLLALVGCMLVTFGLVNLHFGHIPSMSEITSSFDKPSMSKDEVIAYVLYHIKDVVSDFPPNFELSFYPLEKAEYVGEGVWNVHISGYYEVGTPLPGESLHQRTLRMISLDYRMQFFEHTRVFRVISSK